jgi:hypothetical protein
MLGCCCPCIIYGQNVARIHSNPSLFYKNCALYCVLQQLTALFTMSVTGWGVGLVSQYIHVPLDNKHAGHSQGCCIHTCFRKTLRGKLDLPVRFYPSEQRCPMTPLIVGSTLSRLLGGMLLRLLCHGPGAERAGPARIYLVLVNVLRPRHTNTRCVDTV